MSDEVSLPDIRLGLAEQETAWSEYEFGQSHFEWDLDTIKELCAEVERLTAQLAIAQEYGRTIYASAEKYQGERDELRAEVEQLRDVNMRIENSIRIAWEEHEENHPDCLSFTDPGV